MLHIVKPYCKLLHVGVHICTFFSLHIVERGCTLYCSLLHVVACCCMFLHPIAHCWTLLHIVVKSLIIYVILQNFLLKAAKHFSSTHFITVAHCCINMHVVALLFMLLMHIIFIVFCFRCIKFYQRDLELRMKQLCSEFSLEKCNQFLFQSQY